MRVHGWNIASHGVAHRDVRALLGQRPQKVFARQDAQNVIAEYPMAVLKQSTNSNLAYAWVDFILSPESQAVLAKYGFAAA